MARLIREAEVAELLTIDDAISAVREVCLAQGRTGLAEQPRRRLRAEGAVLSELFADHPTRGLIGGKVYVVTRSGQVRFLVQIFSQEDGRLLGLIEADRLGQLRTGAASAVATDVLANAGARRLGMIGAGYQAETQLEAIAKVRPVDEARVFARNQGKLEEFCRRMIERTGVATRPAQSAAEALDGADIVVTATSAREPVLFARDIAAGQHINAIGSNRPHERELEGAAVLRAAAVVVDSRATAKVEAGDLTPLTARGEIDVEELPNLGEVLTGQRPGRRHPDDVTLFLSQGIAAWDLAVGAVVLERAAAAGIGQEVAFLS